MRSFVSLFTLVCSIVSYVNAMDTAMDRVLIIGAGPSGLATAKVFQDKGIPTDIIEKRDTLESDGAGIAIPANGTWALKQLGIDISASARHIPSMIFTDAQGDILTHEDIRSIHPDGDQFYSLTRKQLIDSLKNGLKHPENIRMGTRVSSLEEKEGGVRVGFSDETEGFYSLVIACDGIHSQIRKIFHPEERAEFLNLHVWRTVIDAPEIEIPTYMMGGDCLVLLYPLPNGKAYVYGHLFQETPTEVATPFVEVFQNFGGMVPSVLEKMTQQGPKFYTHHMEKSHSVRFRPDESSHILLIGDAAHGFGPMLQNGAAQAFEDAYVLKLLLENGASFKDLITSFEERRRPRVQMVFDASNTKIRVISNPVEAEAIKTSVRTNGAPNVNGFKILMKTNP